MSMSKTDKKDNLSPNDKNNDFFRKDWASNAEFVATGFSGPSLPCLGWKGGNGLLKDVFEGVIYKKTRIL